MGKIYDSLLGGTSGRTGRIVVANVFGNEITRGIPKKRTKAPTAKQQMVQERMRLCAQFMESYKAYACKHFGVRMGMRSCYNLAMTNLMTCFVIDHAAQTITPDYAEIYFSKGSLLTVVPTTLEATTAGVVTVNWYDNSGANVERAADFAQILVAAEGEKTSFFYENAATRADATYDVHLPASYSGKTVHVWLAFRDAAGEVVSHSVYLGSVTLI